MSSSINFFPSSVAEYTLRFLPPEDLERVTCINSKWRILASKEHLWKAMDLTKVLPLKVLGEKDWRILADCEALGLDPAEAPFFNQNKATVIFLKTLCKQVEGGAGITDLTIPKGLSLKKLREFGLSPKEGNIATFFYIWAPFLTAFGEETLSRTVRVFITNSILKKSRILPCKERLKLASNIGCKIPKILTASTLAILTYVNSKKESPMRLYSDNPPTYTCCLEEIDGRKSVVGNFGLQGLKININHQINLDTFGVSAVWEV